MPLLGHAAPARQPRRAVCALPPVPGIFSCACSGESKRGLREITFALSAPPRPRAGRPASSASTRPLPATSTMRSLVRPHARSPASGEAVSAHALPLPLPLSCCPWLPACHSRPPTRRVPCSPARPPIPLVRGPPGACCSGGAARRGLPGGRAHRRRVALCGPRQRTGPRGAGAQHVGWGPSASALCWACPVLPCPWCRAAAARWARWSALPRRAGRHALDLPPRHKRRGSGVAVVGRGMFFFFFGRIRHPLFLSPPPPPPHTLTHTVYLVDRVIPMLPRLLCEELCRWAGARWGCLSGPGGGPRVARREGGGCVGRRGRRLPCQLPCLDPSWQILAQPPSPHPPTHTHTQHTQSCPPPSLPPRPRPHRNPHRAA